ncbi:MAG: Trm112 family protein, partial [Vulcanisaeta sp.]|nr:Trm112 family protein [Vulcanisaeta sp.]
MKYRLMDVLACPYCKTFPLTLVVLREKGYPERKYEWSKKPFCEEYC